MQMREKLEEAWERAYPDCRIAWMRNRFTRLLDAEAWLDAEMMLVPEGWASEVTRHADGRGEAMMWPETPARTAWGTAPTPAEALLAAIEKARTV